MRITASILVCCTAAGVAVGALALDPVRSKPTRSAPSVVTTTTTTEADVRSNRRTTSTTAAPAASTAAASFAIKGFAFGDAVHVAPGATVTVTNGDSSDHTVTPNDGGFTGVPVPADGQNTFVAPNAPGTYSFFCQIHPGMTGMLVVG